MLRGGKPVKNRPCKELKSQENKELAKEKRRTMSPFYTEDDSKKFKKQPYGIAIEIYIFL